VKPKNPDVGVWRKFLAAKDIAKALDERDPDEHPWGGWKLSAEEFSKEGMLRARAIVATSKDAKFKLQMDPWIHTLGNTVKVRYMQSYENFGSAKLSWECSWEACGDNEKPAWGFGGLGAESGWECDKTDFKGSHTLSGLHAARTSLARTDLIMLGDQKGRGARCEFSLEHQGPTMKQFKLFALIA
jgi:hypothetical protein